MRPMRDARPVVSIGWSAEPMDPNPLVCWVSVAKMEASWRKDGLYIGPNGTPDDQPGKYERAGAWFAECRHAWMPHISLDKAGTVCFSDGRHRFAWVRDNGAKALPVTVDRHFEGAIRKQFGTRLRTCLVWADSLKTPR